MRSASQDGAPMWATCFVMATSPSGASGGTLGALECGMTMPRAVLFDLLTALLDSWTVWNATAGSERAGRAWRAEYLRRTYGCRADPGRRGGTSSCRYRCRS